ncbi:hypothetical protein MRX96_002425 [Rhipicephalus microplus]
MWARFSRDILCVAVFTGQSRASTNSRAQRPHLLGFRGLDGDRGHLKRNDLRAGALGETWPRSSALKQRAPLLGALCRGNGFPSRRGRRRTPKTDGRSSGSLRDARSWSCGLSLPGSATRRVSRSEG